MKLAKQSDLRRALEQRNSPNIAKITALNFSGVPGMADADLIVSSDHLAICGGTGSGKSAILSLMHLCLTGENDVVDTPHRLTGATASISVSLMGQTFHGSATVGSDDRQKIGYDPKVSLLSLNNRTGDVESFLSHNDPCVAKEGVNGSLFDTELVSLVSAVCRKDYRKIEVFEIETDNDKIIPYFEITTPTYCYDSRSMSTGELSAFYMAWAVQFSDPNTILLIEEPEAYLPPSSHAAAFSLISIPSVRRRLTYAITTHSCEIVDQFSSRNLISIRSSGGLNVVSSQHETKEKILYRLGLKPQKSAVVFLEDDLALWICDEIVSQYDFCKFCNFELIARGGHAKVRSSLEGLSDQIKSVSFLGILDGDVKDEAATWKLPKKVFFLPFVSYMERELIEAIAANPSAFAGMASRPLARVNDALADTVALEYHDRFNEIAKIIRVPIEEFARLAFRRWQKQKGNARTVRKFANSLAEYIGVPLA